MAKFKINQVNQISVEYGNEPGTTAKLTAALATAGVSIRGFVVEAEPHDQLVMAHFVTDQDAEAVKVIESIGLKPVDVKILSLECNDAPGVLAKLATAFGDAGINMLNLYTGAISDSHDAIIYLEVEGDLAKATEVAGALEI